MQERNKMNKSTKETETKHDFQSAERAAQKQQYQCLSLNPSSDPSSSEMSGKCLTVHPQPSESGLRVKAITFYRL